MISPMSLKTFLELMLTFLQTSHISASLKCCGHDTWRCLCKWKSDWSGWYGPGPSITIYWFLLLNRLNGRQLSKQIADDGLWYKLSQIITCVSIPVWRSGDVVGYACLRLGHESQKERLSYTDNEAETADQRESSARMMDVVYSHQSYLMAKKGVAYPSVLKSTLQLDLYVCSLSPLF